MRAIGTPASRDLQPYGTMTPSATSAQPAGLIQRAESAIPSPTPFAYTIKAGDTLGQIADKFNVQLDLLLAANPNVDPNSMRVGDTLKIPSNQKNTTGESTPTPAPFSVKEIGCHRTADGGLWCFALAHNDSPDTMENVTAQFTLTDSAGKSVASQTALLPLNILPANVSLPLSVFFAPGLPPDVHPQVQVLTAIRLLADDQRYLHATVQNTQAQVDWSGFSAQVSGRVVLPSPSKSARTVWVAAVAYDGAGNVAGVRRWESTDGLPAGNSLPFSFIVSSISGRIQQVEFAVEARP
jgi:hypothetical protein